MNYSILLFDLDGTLTDPAEGIINSVIYALEKMGIIENDRKKLQQFIGPPLHLSFGKFYGLSEEASFEAVRMYREYFADRGIFENKVYEGIPEFLSMLKRSGGTLVLATSKPTVYANQILEHFGLDQYFSFVQGANLDGSMTDKTEIIAACLDQYPDHPKTDFLMIGDREHDIIGANNNGIASVWVSYGFGQKSEVA